MILAGLIPEEFFQAKADILLWLLAGGGVALLVYGAGCAVNSAAKLAAILGLSKVIIGATVVSLGTTSPEAAVSVNAAIRAGFQKAEASALREQGQTEQATQLEEEAGRNAGLSLGNGVGSIICDTALIFGLCCCLTRIPKDRFVLNRQGWLQFGAGALLTVVLLALWAISGDIHNVEIPRLVGCAFLVLLVLYIYLSIRWSRKHPQMVPGEAKAEMKENHKGGRALGNLAILFVGLGLVVFGAEVLVGSAKVICRRHNVPEEIIAVTVVAFGTSLPELVTAITSVIKGHAELMVGNVIGADILNVLFVIGASSAAVPLKVDPRFYYFLIPVMLLVLAVLRVAIFHPGASFRRAYGGILLGIYAAFALLAVRLGVMQ